MKITLTEKCDGFTVHAETDGNSSLHCKMGIVILGQDETKSGAVLKALEACQMIEESAKILKEKISAL